MLPDIEKNLPVPPVYNWEDLLSRMEKGNSFIFSTKDHLHNVYDAAKNLGLKITHRDRGTYVRVWRIS